MSTVAMILFFLMLLSYIQNVITGNRLEFSLSQLHEADLELDNTREQLERTRAEIDEAQKNLELFRGEIELRRAEVEKCRMELSLSEAELELSRTELALSQNELVLSEGELAQKQRIIDETNIELGNLRVKLEEIAVLRLTTLNKVKASIEATIGTHSAAGEELVTIGDNANIIINETLVFDYGSAEIKEDATPLLDQFAVAFEELLDDAETRDYIDMITIEGHTDSRGSAGYNRSLSSERAVSVVNYMMESNPTLEDKYARYFGVTGFSKFRPIAFGEDEDAMQLNRRIEISVIVKDSNISRVIDEYLSEVAE